MLRLRAALTAVALLSPCLARAAAADLHLHLPMIESQVRLVDLEAADVRLLVAVAYAPPVLSQLRGGYARELLRQFGRIERWAARDPRVRVVRTPEEAEAVLESPEWGLGVVLAAEGAGGADTPERLQRLWDRGLRVLTLAHFSDTSWGGAAAGRYWPFPTCVPGGKGPVRLNPAGLSAEGKAMLDWAAAQGLLLDFTHASDRAALDAAARRPDMPLLFTHEAARELTPCERTISPELLAEVKRSRGMVGLSMAANYAGPDLKSLLAHAAALARGAGPEAVALGSDFNGLVGRVEGAAGPEDYARVLAALEEAGVPARGGAERFVELWRRSLPPGAK